VSPVETRAPIAAENHITEEDVEKKEGTTTFMN